MRHVDLQYRDANSACGHWTALQITGTMRDVLPVTLEDAFCMQSSLSSCLLFQIYPPDGKKDIRSKEPAALSSELEVRLLVEGGYFALACLFDSSSDFRSPPPHTHTHTHAISFPEMLLLSHWRHTRVVRALSHPRLWKSNYREVTEGLTGTVWFRALNRLNLLVSTEWIMLTLVVQL